MNKEAKMDFPKRQRGDGPWNETLRKVRQHEDGEKVTTFADRMSLVTFGRAVAVTRGQKTEEESVSRSEDCSLPLQVSRRMKWEDDFTKRWEQPWRQGNVVQSLWKGKRKHCFENTEEPKREGTSSFVF